MKMKRRIGLLLCCLAVMGMISASVIPVQAAERAVCKHPHFMIVYDAVYRSFSRADGHYNEQGTEYICADCRYTYWTNLHEVKMGDHEWKTIEIPGTDQNGDPILRKRCRICNATKPY